MRRLYSIAAAAALAAAMFSPAPAQAHEVKRAGTLDILLHRDPQESPIAREPAQLYFSVTDSAGKFDFSDCLCRVAVSLASQTLVDRALTAADEAPDWGEQVSRVDFTFPKLGVYEVSISGKSKAGLFQDFKLDYDVRVERESQTVPETPASGPPPSRQWSQIYYRVGGAALVLAIIANEITIRRKKSNK